MPRLSTADTNGQKKAARWALLQSQLESGVKRRVCLATSLPQAQGQPESEFTRLMVRHIQLY